MTDSLNEKSLKERWMDYMKSTHLDLRGLLIEAVSQHEGWEESAIALVDEAIMPVLDGDRPCEICVISEIRSGISEHVRELYQEDTDKLTAAIMEYVKPYLRTTEPVSLNHMGAAVYGTGYTNHLPASVSREIAKAVLDAAGVKYVDR